MLYLLFLSISFIDTVCFHWHSRFYYGQIHPAPTLLHPPLSLSLSALSSPFFKTNKNQMQKDLTKAENASSFPGKTSIWH